MDPKQVNVLDLPKRPGLVETPLDHISRTFPAPTISDIEENEIAPSDNSESRTRRKRQVVILPEAIVDNEGRTRHVVTMVNHFLFFCFKLLYAYPILSQLKDCGKGTAKCFMFRCNIRNLQRKQSAVIKIRAR